MSVPGPTREVVEGDGVAWLQSAELTPAHAVVTSLPDRSGLPDHDHDAWRAWFVATAERVCRAVDPRSVAVFYQSDVFHAGRWIDKGYLVARGAEAAGAHCVFHKIVCRHPPGTVSQGRPGYGHWLAFSRGLRPGADGTTDVLPELGLMTWSRAMPLATAVATCRFLETATDCRTVVDPFCGLGTMLAVANAHGLDALGVELDPRRARKARTMRLDGQLDR